MEELFYYVAAAGTSLILINSFSDIINKNNRKKEKILDYKLAIQYWRANDLARLARNHAITDTEPSKFYDEKMQGIPPAFDSSGIDINIAFRNCPEEAEQVYSELEELTQQYITEASS